MKIIVYKFAKKLSISVFSGTLARKLAKTFFCKKYFFSIFCHPDVANFLRVFVWWYHFINFLLRVSLKYLKMFIIKFCVPCQQCSSCWAKASLRQSFLGRKFPFVEMFPKFWPLICSLEVYIIYLLRAGWTPHFYLL